MHCESMKGPKLLKELGNRETIHVAVLILSTWLFRTQRKGPINSHSTPFSSSYEYEAVGVHVVLLDSKERMHGSGGADL